MSAPFSRALAIFLLAQQAQGDMVKLSEIPQYVSHGHGRGKYSGKGHGNPVGHYMPHQGAKEKARRVRQMAAGIL